MLVDLVWKAPPMPLRLTALKIKNFKCLRDVELTDIPPFCAFIGANGSGKSTLFEALIFFRTAFKDGVDRAFRGMGGYEAVISRGQEGEDIKFEFEFVEEPEEDEREGREFQFIYSLSLGPPRDGEQFIAVDNIELNEISYGGERRLIYVGSLREYTKPRKLRDVLDPEPSDTVQVRNYSDIPVIIQRDIKKEIIDAIDGYVEGWQKLELTPDALRMDVSKTLGREVLTEARGIAARDPQAWESIQETMRSCIPGLSQVELALSPGGNPFLRFHDGSLKEPMLGDTASDGTMRLFAYLVLLHAPKPYSLLCVEEPENYLYPGIQKRLAEEFRAYAHSRGQVFASTHSPDFLDALAVEEVCWLVKEKGFTKIIRAKDDPQVVAYMEEGDKMGLLWQHGLFRGADPR